MKVADTSTAPPQIRRLTTAVKAGIGVTVLGMVVVQLGLLPLLASETATQNPEYSHLRYPVLMGCIAVVACGQIVAGCVWKLLGLVEAGTTFTAQASRWVTVVVRALLTAAGLIVALWVYTATQGAGHPGTLLLTLAGVTATVTVALLMLVMQQLLRQATLQRSELDGVI